ncbi:MAG: hypothetical protein M1817_002163 [Caeruleum heppii]|nr:MAG: hypothetical protein M1817_002163 [Caeruleum heppii]
MQTATEADSGLTPNGQIHHLQNGAFADSQLNLRKAAMAQPTTNGSVTYGQSQDDASSRTSSRQARSVTPLSATFGMTSPAVSDGPQSHFNPFNLQRTNSIYSLSRASFSSQLSQLTSLQLPQASSLSSSISSIATSTAATKALTGAAEQIRRWIQKASEVLDGLEAEDDVEWAAAGGREGLGEVDNAIGRFEELIGVYVGAIENLQLREDIASVPTDELKAVVQQMERTLKEWEQVRTLLKGVKQQVELAMEWEELWNGVLGDIGLEVDELVRLVFEMEEKRHTSLMGEGLQEADNGIDLADYENTVEETPPSRIRSTSKRFSITPVFPTSSPLQSPGLPSGQDDSSLLALFARMQPLRASLDFLPMRLSSFHARAAEMFPTACEELHSRRKSLETSWKKLEADAESLRRELGEDRWVLVFRNAGRQAQMMCDSVSRSIVKLKEALDTGSPHTNSSSMNKKMESYEAKKMHYGPAIERVLAIIERGVKDRLTVNGEVLRLRSDVEELWRSLEGDMKKMDAALEDLNTTKNQQFRDSLSSIISIDRSTTNSGVNTPGSSPASSVIMGGPNDPLTPLTNGKTRPHMKSRGSSLPRPNLVTARRHLSMPPTSAANNPPTSRRPPSSSRLSSTPVPNRSAASPSPYRNNRDSATPTPSSWTPRPGLSNEPSKPRWNGSVSTRDAAIGHNFNPLTLTTPSPHRKTPTPMRSTPHLSASVSSTSSSRLPHPSPLGQERSDSPSFKYTTTSRSSLSFRDGAIQPGVSPARSIGGSDRPTPLRTRASSSQLPDSMSLRTTARGRTGRSDALGLGQIEENDGGDPTTPQPNPHRSAGNARPASALAHSRRSSMLPQPRTPGLSSGRMSMAGHRSSLMAGGNGGGSVSRERAGAGTPSGGRMGVATAERPKWR